MELHGTVLYVFSEYVIKNIMSSPQKCQLLDFVASSLSSNRFYYYCNMELHDSVLYVIYTN